MRAALCALTAAIIFVTSTPALAGCYPWDPCEVSDPDADIIPCNDPFWYVNPVASNRIRYAGQYNSGAWFCFEIDCHATRNTIKNLATYGIDNKINWQRNGSAAYGDQYKDSFWRGNVYPVWPGTLIENWGSAAQISSLACYPG